MTKTGEKIFDWKNFEKSNTIWPYRTLQLIKPLQGHWIHNDLTVWTKDRTTCPALPLLSDFLWKKLFECLHFFFSNVSNETVLFLLLLHLEQRDLLQSCPRPSKLRGSRGEALSLDNLCTGNIHNEWGVSVFLLSHGGSHAASRPCSGNNCSVTCVLWS